MCRLLAPSTPSIRRTSYSTDSQMMMTLRYLPLKKLLEFFFVICKKQKKLQKNGINTNIAHNVYSSFYHKNFNHLFRNIFTPKIIFKTLKNIKEIS